MLVAVCATPEGSPGGILYGSPEGVTVAEFNEMSDGESAVLLSASSTSMRSGWTRERHSGFFFDGMEEAMEQKLGRVTPFQEQLIRDKGVTPSLDGYCLAT